MSKNKNNTMFFRLLRVCENREQISISGASIKKIFFSGMKPLSSFKNVLKKYDEDKRRWSRMLPAEVIRDIDEKAALIACYQVV